MTDDRKTEIGEAGARLRALVAQIDQALDAASRGIGEYARQTMAANPEMISGLKGLEDARRLTRQLDALLSAPVVSPPTLYETASPEHRAIADRVMQRVQEARTKAQAIGGGRSPTQEDDSQRLWACGCYEDQGGYHLCLTHAKEAAAPVVCPHDYHCQVSAKARGELSEATCTCGLAYAFERIARKPRGQMPRPVAPVVMPEAK